MKTGKKTFHFPTALGLLILIIAIVVGVTLVKTRTGLDTKADITVAPKQVRITNVTDTGATVSWLTEKAALGLVKYGIDGKTFKNQVLDDRDQLSGGAEAFLIHHVTLKSLKPGTKYYFKIESGTKQYDNNGKPFEITTGQTLGTPPAADPIYGTVLTPSGATAEGVLVYINVANGGALSAITKANGSWALSLSTARSADLSSYLDYDTQATIVNILAQGGSQGTASVITTTSNDSPVPDVTLGQSHDFRAGIAPELPSMADNSTGMEEPETPSGFTLDPVATDSAEASSSGEVTLDNPSFNGEVINATQPAIIGTGPEGTVLSITINSENEYTGSATITEDGSWEFIPPEGLEPGEHTVTVSYVDTEGVEQTISRNFVVAAAGESETPAITATPSGEATDSGRTEQPSTESGVPEPGTFEITLLMLLSGLGLLIGGMVIKNKVNS